MADVGTSKTLRVGIIGASAERGWAKISHVPAVRQLGGLELAAVVTQDQPSADKAAKAFGAAKGYGSANALFADPDIDIIAVAVNVPAHRELVLAALSAGKHLYCEYPLGRDAAESEELAEAGRRSGVHVAIGLQLRGNPAVVRARALIEAGAVGRVLSARVLSTTMAFGPETETAMAFAERPENGVTLVTIQGAHTIDLAFAVLGPIADLSTLVSTQYEQITVAGERPQSRVIPDHLLLTARVAEGAPLSVEVAGGRAADATPFLFEVTGETGTLVLKGGAPRGVQSGLLKLLLNGTEQAFDASAVEEPNTAANVAVLYAALRDDINNSTWTVPDFDHAARLSRLVEVVLASSCDGRRVSARV